MDFHKDTVKWYLLFPRAIAIIRLKEMKRSVTAEGS